MLLNILDFVRVDGSLLFVKNRQMIRVGNLPIHLSLICSDHSNQMSNCEQIAQMAFVKKATMSKSLRSLMTKEHP